MTTATTQAAERGNIETFLQVNSIDIPDPETRAKMREAAAKAISGAELNDRHCPPHLRDAFRRIVHEAAYIERVKGQKVNPKEEVMPTQGKADSRMSRNCRL